MRSLISVRTQFESLHCYPNAPERVSYLRNVHRHSFFVEAKIEVFHDDRELEFIIVKEDLSKFIQESLVQRDMDKLVSMSCEMMAKSIMTYLSDSYGSNRRYFVSVYEDNENGAEVYSENFFI